MKKILQIALLVLMLAALLVLAPSGAMVAQAEILELPLDAFEGLPPQESGYLSDWAYEDPSISVSIETGRYEETNYMLAHVKLANPTQLRTAMATNYYNPSTTLGSTIAKRCKAVLAINGDFFSSRNGAGLVTRQGKEYRLKCNGYYDVLIIDDQGDLHILPEATNQDVEAFAGVIVQGFTFGPGLIIEGEKQTDLAKHTFAGGQKPAQRMCLAQIGPLEYLHSVRIHAATRLLKENPDLTIRRVAELCGYINIDSFNRAFKRIIGTTAGKYREKLSEMESKKNGNDER